MLDHIAMGIVLLDGVAQLLFANTAARSMATAEGPIRLGPGLHSPLPDHDCRLREAIGQTLGGAPFASLCLPAHGSQHGLLVLLSSLRGNDGDPIAQKPRCSAILAFLSDPAKLPDAAAGRLVEVYELTSAEAKVASAIASGATVPETAARLAVSPNTVKTHLRRVFAKTGTSGRTDLVLAIASLRMLTT